MKVTFFYFLIWSSFFSYMFQCDGVVEEGEELIAELFKKGEKNIEDKLCHEALKMCSKKLDSDDRDEL